MFINTYRKIKNHLFINLTNLFYNNESVCLLPKPERDIRNPKSNNITSQYSC